MSIKYKYLNPKHEFGPEGCDSCGYEAPLALFQDRIAGDRNICELCATSFVSNATKYPDQYENVPLFKSIAVIGNIILDKTTNRRKELNEPL